VGKSVALRFYGLSQADAGSIHVEGQEISGLDEEGMNAIRKRVTMSSKTAPCSIDERARRCRFRRCATSGLAEDRWFKLWNA